MSDPYYCKLYIDTDEAIDELEISISEFVKERFTGIEVEYPIFRNEDFEASATGRTPYDFIAASKYYVELGTIEEIPEQIEKFHSKTANLIAALREGGRFVTASCDFEDLIAAETGWNWTEEDPQPPGRDLRLR